MSLQTAALERGHTRYRPYRMGAGINRLGDRMRKVRLHRQYSQSAAARLCDVAKQTISNWETGINPPSLDHLLTFARAMDVDVGELFGGLLDGLKPIEPWRRQLPTKNQILPHYGTLSEAGSHLMGSRIEADRYYAACAPHAPKSVAITIDDRTMEPRFAATDTVTFEPVTIAEPDSLVLARVGDRIVFRRFLPHREGKIHQAILRPLNRDCPDIEMGDGDQILGLFKEHRSTRPR